MVMLLAVLVIPLPTVLLDMGLAVSITASVLVLMVAMFLRRPLDFTSFPTLLLLTTLAAAVAERRHDKADPKPWQRGPTRGRATSWRRSAVS